MNMYRKLTVIALMSVGLPGCAGFGMGGMSADQINAVAKDKSSAVACTSFTGMGGQFQVMYVNNDKTFQTGGGTTAVECGGGKVTFQDAGNLVKSPAPAPALIPFIPKQ